MKGLEWAHRAALAELKAFAGCKRHHAPRDDLSVEATGSVEQLFDLRCNESGHEVGALAHAQHGATSCVLRNRPDVIEVPVAHEHGWLPHRTQRATAHVEHQVQLGNLDAGLDARNAEAFELHGFTPFCIS